MVSACRYVDWARVFDIFEDEHDIDQHSMGKFIEMVDPDVFVTGPRSPNQHAHLYLKKGVSLEIIENVSDFTWDITHASNNGVYNQHEMTWHPIVENLIDQGAIGEVILPPNARIPNSLGMDMCVGGHNTLFAVSEKVSRMSSCGTWGTASVPVVEGGRFINGVRAYYDCGWLFSPHGAQVMIDNFSESRCWKFEAGIGWGAHFLLKTLTESGYGIYTSRDNTVTLCKRDYNLGSLTDF